MLNIISNRAIDRTMGRTMGRAMGRAMGRGVGRAAVGAALGVGLIAASTAFGQLHDPDLASPKIPGVIEQLQFPGGTLQGFVEYLQAEVEPIQINVLYRNGAQLAKIPSIHLQNVYLRTALQSAIYGSTLDFAMIEGQFGSNVYVITGEVKVDTSVAVEVARATEIITVGDLFAQGSTQLSDVLEAIDVAVHDETQTTPNWRRPEIRFHEPSGLLIVQGTSSQVATVGEVVSRMSEASINKRMQHLQQASDRIRLEADLAELQVQVSVASDQHDMAQIQYKEVVQRRDQGAGTLREVHEAELAVTMTLAELRIVNARLHAAEAQLDLFNRAEAIERTSRTYEFGSISGAGKELRAALAAIAKLSGPKITVRQTESELTVNATKEQHAVVAAVIDAMKAAASLDPH